MADNNVVIQMLDLKGPLKGKGAYLAQWRRDAEDRLAEIYAQMEELAQRTRVVEGRRFSLQVHKLRNAKQLRWRFGSAAEGVASRHATWERIAQLLPEFNQVLASWYESLNELAQVLNAQEQVLRYECKTVQRLTTGAVMKIRVRAFEGEMGHGVAGSRPSNSRL